MKMLGLENPSRILCRGAVALSLTIRRKLSLVLFERKQQFRNVLQSNTVLSEFDRSVFESVIKKVITGEQEDGSVEPYQLTCVFKTGLKSSIQGMSGMKSPKKSWQWKRGVRHVPISLTIHVESVAMLVRND